MAKKDFFSGFSDDDEPINNSNEGGTDEGSGEGDDGNKGNDNQEDDNSDTDTNTDSNTDVDTNKNDDDDNEGNNDDDEGNGDQDGKDDDNEGKDDDGDDGSDEGNADKTEKNDFDLSLEDDSSDDDNQENKEVNYLNDAKELEIELEEGVESLTRQEFFEKVKNKIESSKEQFSYQGIAEENLPIVKYFAEEGGSVAELLNDNDVVLATSLLNMSDKEKFLMMKKQGFVNAGLTEEEASERAEEMFDGLSEDDMARAVKKIDQDLIAFKKHAIGEVVKLKNAINAKENERIAAKAQAEQAEMIKAVNSMEKFFEMNLPADVKAKIVEKIKSGDVDKFFSQSLASAKLNAYLIAKFGKQVTELQKKIMNTKSAKSYNKGVEKFIEKNHGKKPDSREKPATSGGEKSKWDGLRDIEG